MSRGANDDDSHKFVLGTAVSLRAALSSETKEKHHSLNTGELTSYSNNITIILLSISPFK